MITLSKKESSNKKLGAGVYTTYRAVGETCPSSCKALQTGACYALSGNVALHQRKSAQDNTDGARLRHWLENLPKGRFVRHHVSGDLFKGDRPDKDYIDSMLEGHANRPDLKGWTYTHGWKALDSRHLNSARSLTVNASCDNELDLIEAVKNGWPATVIVSEEQGSYTTNDGVRVVVCPEQTHGVACAQCQLCFRKNRKAAIGFRIHGTTKKRWTNP